MIPDSWQRVPLGQLGRIVTGRTPSSAQPEHFGRELPFITPTDMTGERHVKASRFLSPAGASALSRVVVPGGVAVSCIGWQMGKSAVIEGPAVTNQQINTIVPGPGVDLYFLYYSLAGRRQEIFQLGSGGSRTPIVNKSTIAKLQLALPPPPEQRAIARILGTLDDKIELNRRMNKTLEAMARAIFKSWFVDFDPVRAKMEGHQPVGMDAETAALFPDSVEESALGKIPKGWQVGALQDVLAELETGSRPKGGVSGYRTGVPSIGAESIVGLGVFDYSKTKYVPEAFFERMTKGRVQSRDVLLYKDGGRPGEFEPHLTLVGDGFPFDTCAVNEHVYRLRAMGGFGQHLLFFWLSSGLVIEEMRTKGTGVAIPGLNSTQVKSLTTLVPTPEVPRAFNGLVEPLIARVLSACKECRTLAALRDALLRKLISGEMRIAPVLCE